KKSPRSCRESLFAKGIIPVHLGPFSPPRFGGLSGCDGYSPAATRLMNSILVIQLKRIGDVIATTPALRALRKLYPEAHITLLLEEHSAAIAPALATQINELWLYNRGASFNLWLNLVRRGFDLCLDFTGNDRSALITFLSKAARRLGYSDIAKRP